MANAQTTQTHKTAVQKAALAVGIVFLAVGVLGFIPSNSQYLWIGVCYAAC